MWRGLELKLSIIIPTLDDGAALRPLLRQLQGARHAGHELILVDGGSRDDTCEMASSWVDRLLQSPPGRARQMNLGAEAAQGDWLWFLHADSRLPEGWLEVVEAHCHAPHASWAFFKVRLDNPRWPYRLIAWAMSTRACLTRMATGDQAILVRRRRFFEVGGYPDIPLMEDLALSRALRSWKPACLEPPLVTSARRWERQGLVRTVLRMWHLRLAYWLGVSPQRLARRYPPCNSPGTRS